MESGLISGSPLPIINKDNMVKETFDLEVRLVEVNAILPFTACVGSFLQLDRLVSSGRSPGYMKDRWFLKSWMMLEKRKIKSVV